MFAAAQVVTSKLKDNVTELESETADSSAASDPSATRSAELVRHAPERL
jgi:hypothetical protein